MFRGVFEGRTLAVKDSQSCFLRKSLQSCNDACLCVSACVQGKVAMSQSPFISGSPFLFLPALVHTFVSSSMPISFFCFFLSGQACLSPLNVKAYVKRAHLSTGWGSAKSCWGQLLVNGHIISLNRQKYSSLSFSRSRVTLEHFTNWAVMAGVLSSH